MVNRSPLWLLFQVILEPRGCLSEVALIDDSITPIHATGFMPHDFHRYGFRHTGPRKVSRGASSEVMHDDTFVFLPFAVE